jgi:hypothetical protein
MSAVAIALSTPIYAMADTKDSVLFRGIPPGDYKLYVWIKGVPKFFLDNPSRPVHFSDHAVDFGDHPGDDNRRGTDITNDSLVSDRD